MSANAAWREARDAAHRLRVELLGGGGIIQEIPADKLVAAALKFAGLRCQLRKPSDPLLSGAHAVLDMEFMAVWVRADAAAPERSVFIAHELAHLHLHHSHDEDELCHCEAHDFSDSDMFLTAGYGPRQRRETEANVFAREFVLPTPLAHRLFNDGWDARTIALRLNLPISVVFAQLTERFDGSDEDSADIPLPTLEQIPPSEFIGSLDPSQSEAAKAVQGPLLVVAGPGTGKTRTLAARVLHLVHERGVAPENLLLLTFSRKAVEEMRERVALSDPEIARRAAINTFHSYGLDLLRRHGKAANLPPVPVLLEVSDAIALLERRAAQLDLDALKYLHDPAFPLRGVLDSISRAKEDMLTPEDYAVRAAETGDARLAEAARIFALYEELLQEKGALDYSDLVGRAVRLLETNEAVRNGEREQWQHLLVDEYQDINRGGARLVKALSGDGAGLWVVGDVRQAIYAFRGASPANVAQFEKDFPNGQRMDLAVNYRSRPGLVTLFGIASLEGLHKWQAARANVDEPDATITLAVAPTDKDQQDGIARSMREFADAGYKWRDMAILCRTRKQGKTLRAGLQERGIPVAAPPAENGILSDPLVRELVLILSRAVDPTGPASLKYPELPTGLPFRGDVVDFWFELLWGAPGWARKYGETQGLSEILRFARAFRERMGVLLGERDDTRREFLRHLRRIVRHGSVSVDTGEEDAPDAVRVMTVHSAKGLEFPIVYLPNLSRDFFPPRPAPSLLPPLYRSEEEQGMEEESRLFFVALTRARDHLVLSRANRYNYGSADPSPLLTVVEGAPGLRKVQWRPLEGAFPVPPEPKAPFVEEPVGPKPEVRAEDADLYIRCPRRYYYEKVAEVKGEKSPYSNFIRTVTEALSSDDPVTELEDAWERHGPEEHHPHTPLYRAAAEEIVAREAEKATSRTSRSAATASRLRPRRADKPSGPTLRLPLPNGTITVKPDAVDPMGNTYEYQTFRKPPTSDTPLPPEEGKPYLLQEIAQRESPQDPPTILVRYMQTGEAYPLEDRSRRRSYRIQNYDRALRGIRLNMYEPKPEDPLRCSECPFFFICPE